MDTLWLSYRRASTATDELLLIQEDGTYTIVYTPSAPRGEGTLESAQRAQLVDLLRPERTGSYEQDSLLRGSPAASCDASTAQPVVFSLLWEPTAISTSNGFGCWAQAASQSAATQELLSALNAVLGPPRSP
ncbi:MAG TPA: hypothetical protein VFX59_31205 [Polyangiales bacterium]|nr:hypothetical protein [Polyangiales bacterium]